MHGRGIQGILAILDAQEARGLLEGLGAEAADLQELLTAFEGAVLEAVGHDALGQALADAGYVGQQLVGGAVHVHAHPVHAALDHIVQALLEGGLIHVVLVLAHADALGVHLHQLRQGILEAAGDAHGAAHGDVMLREFLPGDVAGRIDRGAGLAHGHADEVRATGLHQPLADEALHFATAGAVADGDGLDGAGGTELLEDGAAALQVPLGFEGVDDLVLHQLAQSVDDHQLAAGADAGVHAQGAALTCGGRQEQVVQVGLEDLDGLSVGLLLGLVAYLGLDGGSQEAVEGIAAGFVEAAPVAAARIHGYLGHQLAHEVLALHDQLDAEDFLFLAAAQGQQAVAGDLADGLGEVEVGLEAQGGLVGLPLLADLGLEQTLLVELQAQPGTDGGVFRQALRQDVAGALQALRRGAQAVLVLDEGLGDHERVGATGIRQQRIQQGLQAALPGHGGLGALLWLVGQVEILEFRLHPGGLDLGPQLGAELALLIDGLQHGLAAVQEVLVVGVPILHSSDGHFVQGARHFFPVAGDEGDRVPFLQQRHDGSHASSGELELLGHEVQHLIHTCSLRSFPRGTAIIPRTGDSRLIRPLPLDQPQSAVQQILEVTIEIHGNLQHMVDPGGLRG